MTNLTKARRVIESVSSLIEILSSDTQGIDPPIWYRGHSKEEWKLIPSIFRTNDVSEFGLLKQFRQNATLLVDPRPIEYHEWLFVMRQYGIATRLLDWTESPLVALYFAIEANPESDGALWVLQPLGLNKNIPGLEDPDSLPGFRDDRIMEIYSPDKFHQSRVKNLPPIAFIAPRNTTRMQAQLTVYTINGEKNPIEEICDTKYLWKYRIPKEVKSRIKKELSLLGIRKFQLFPELESIRDGITEGFA